MWTVLDPKPTPKSDGYRLLCRCVCGTQKLVSRKYLRNGASKSCGCRGVYPGASLGEFTVLSRDGRNVTVRCSHGLIFESRYSNGGLRVKTCPCDRVFGANKKHGESIHAVRTPEYNAWRQMRQRCFDLNNDAYALYGGRGITVCDRWADFSLFLADMGRKPTKKHSLDRIDVNGNYESSNCRWATVQTQARNRRHSIWLTHNGETLHLKEWADRVGLSYQGLYRRYRKCSDASSVLRGFL